MTMSDNANLIDNVPIPAGLFDGLSNVQVGRIYAYANQCATRFKESADALRAERDALRHDIERHVAIAAEESSRAERAEADAALGRVAMKFVDRAGDYCDVDPAEKICDEFNRAMCAAIAAEKESHS